MLGCCVMSFVKNSFFDEKNCLLSKNRYSIKKEWIYNIQRPLDDILGKIAVNDYKVLLQSVNEMKFGYYNEHRFIFSDNKNIIQKYLVQVRMFNELEEILILRNKDEYYVRMIKDETNEESKLIETVDSTSVLFGKVIKNENLPKGFVELYDKGRKIERIIPSAVESDYYTLITRSYIEYNNKTGQAGYGYYRYVDIKPENSDYRNHEI